MAADRGRWPGDLYVAGNVSANSMTIPDESIGDGAIDPGRPISSLKLEHQHLAYHRQAHGTATVARREVIHKAFGNGVLAGVEATLVVPNVGAATVTIDVLKNGVSVLTSPLVLGVAAAFAASAAGIAGGGTYVADDIFETSVSVAAGGGTIGQGLVVQGVFREAVG